MNSVIELDCLRLIWIGDMSVHSPISKANPCAIRCVIETHNYPGHSIRDLGDGFEIRRGALHYTRGVEII